MTSVIVLFALLIVNLSGIKPALFQIFRVFLNAGNFALYMSTMFYSSDQITIY